jgi:hypothetical protein
MKRRLAALMAGVLMLGAVGVSTASAVVPVPGETIPGNYKCPEGSTYIDPVASGLYALVGGGWIQINVTSTSAGPVFSFVATGAVVGSIVVKGGPNYHVYIFPGGTTSAEGLHAPLNSASGKWYGLSHLCIESEKKDEEPPK